MCDDAMRVIDDVETGSFVGLTDQDETGIESLAQKPVRAKVLAAKRLEYRAKLCMNLLRVIRTRLDRRSVRDRPNHAVTVPPDLGEPILFMGDSITACWGMHRGALFAESGFINRGIGGEMSGQVRARFAPTIAETRPAGVHILCGINDIAHRAAHGEDMDPRCNIAAMLAEARALGVRTWVGSLTPADWLIWGGIDPRDEIAAMNGWLRNYAENAGAIYIDYHTVLTTPSGSLQPEYSEDGLHLTLAGYVAMEPVLLAALRK